MWLDADRDEGKRRDDSDAWNEDEWEPGDDEWDPDDAGWDPGDDQGDPGDDGWDSDGGGWDPGKDRAYWRRRFFILCAGVAALGVCAWLFPGTHQAKARTAAAKASVSALAKGPTLPPAAYGSAYPQPRPKPSPSAKPTPSPTATSTAKPKKKAAKKKVSTAYHPGQGGSATKGKVKVKGGPGPAQCAPADVVLSLLTSQSSYAAGVRPQFNVYAVSTAAAPCTLPYGAGSVQVVVTRHGRVVWDSASCRPLAAEPVRFTRGVPQVVTMIWNPKATQPPGCEGALPAGATGTLDAVALSHGQTSPVHAFKVGG